MAKDTYKQYIPDIGLSIEKGTDTVPHDGKFYVLRAGQVINSFKSLKQAQELFKRIVVESGYKPKLPEVPKRTPGQEQTDRYMDAKEMYWADSHRYRGRGGKGGRGGV